MNGQRMKAEPHGRREHHSSMIQQILALEELRRPGSGFYFFRTHVMRYLFPTEEIHLGGE